MRRAQIDHGFSAIRVEGGLLPPEYLQTVASLQAKAQANTDYGLTRSLNIRDEIGRHWRMACDLWSDFRARRDREGLAPARVTVDEWLRPLLEHVLGYHDIAAVDTASVGERRFPLGHAAFGGAVPLVLVPHDAGLDRADARFGDDGRRRPPHGLLQEYLNA